MNNAGALWHMPKWYYNGSVWLIPIIVVVLLVWWFVQSIGWYPDTWWSPLEVENMGTVLCQWLVVIVIGVALNKFFNRRIMDGPMTEKLEEKR